MTQKHTVADVEETLVYLQGIALGTERGEDEHKIAYPYARTVLAGAERPLKKVGLYEQARHAIDESERLILAGQFDKAISLLGDTAREMMERSGTNDRLRKLYAPPSSTRKQ